MQAGAPSNRVGRLQNQAASSSYSSSNVPAAPLLDQLLSGRAGSTTSSSIDTKKPHDSRFMPPDLDRSGFGGHTDRYSTALFASKFFVLPHVACFFFPPYSCCALTLLQIFLHARLTKIWRWWLDNALIYFYAHVLRCKGLGPMPLDDCRAALLKANARGNGG